MTQRSSQKEFAQFVKDYVPKCLQKPMFVLRKSKKIYFIDRLEFICFLLLIPIRGDTKCIELLQSEYGPEWFKTQL
jgi:hypothetical protein